LKIIEIFLSLKSNQSISGMFLIFISGKPLILHRFFPLKNNGFPMNVTKESFLSQAPTLRQQASVVEMLE